MNPSNTFDADCAYKHVYHFAYPRRVGSPQERQAAQAVTDTFDSYGLEIEREPFGVAPRAVEMGSRILFTICAAMVTAGTIWAAELPLVAALCWLIAAALINRPWRISNYLGNPLMSSITSENLVATLPESAETAPARVIFMAHYDTKSQLLPTGIRVALVMIATWTLVGMAVTGAIVGIGFPQLFTVLDPWVPTVIVTICLAGLIANSTGNRSPGALDNGSGLGTMLELARTWRPRPDALVEVVWVATGSEEVGLNGARNFLHRHGHWWEEKPTLLINLESVGAGPLIYLAGEHDAVQLAETTANDLELTHARLHILGAGMDHEPFAAHGLTALSILGSVVRRSFHLHSRRDDMWLIERSALERAGKLAAALAWRWAETHQSTVTSAPILDIQVEPV